MKRIIINIGIFIISYITFLFISYKTAVMIPIHSFDNSVIISGLCILFSTVVLCTTLIITKFNENKRN